MLFPQNCFNIVEVTTFIYIYGAIKKATTHVAAISRARVRAFSSIKPLIFDEHTHTHIRDMNTCGRTRLNVLTLFERAGVSADTMRCIKSESNHMFGDAKNPGQTLARAGANSVVCARNPVTGDRPPKRAFRPKSKFNFNHCAVCAQAHTHSHSHGTALHSHTRNVAWAQAQVVMFESSSSQTIGDAELRCGGSAACHT